MPDPMPPPGGPDPLDRIFDALGVSRLAHMIDDGDDCHPAPSERFNEAAAVTPDGTIEPRRTSSSLSNLQFLIQSRPKAFAIAAALRAAGRSGSTSPATHPRPEKCEKAWRAPTRRRTKDRDFVNRLLS